jgi:hypothetical protein
LAWAYTFGSQLDGRTDGLACALVRVLDVLIWQVTNFILGLVSFPIDKTQFYFGIIDIQIINQQRKNVLSKN